MGCMIVRWCTVAIVGVHLDGWNLLELDCCHFLRDATYSRDLKPRDFHVRLAEMSRYGFTGASKSRRYTHRTIIFCVSMTVPVGQNYLPSEFGFCVGFFRICVAKLSFDLENLCFVKFSSARDT